MGDFKMGKIIHGGHVFYKKTYNTWACMKDRCFNVNSAAYKDYGGRGISVCKEWVDSFANFLKDMREKPDGKSIDRIDNDGNYCPENCRWATQSEQNNNQGRCNYLTLDGETLTITQWANRLGISAPGLRWRLRSGWDICSALTTPEKSVSRNESSGRYERAVDKAKGGKR
jgi:hypothetical protein